MPGLFLRLRGGGNGDGVRVSGRETRAIVGDGWVVNSRASEVIGVLVEKGDGSPRVAHQPTPEIRLDEQRRALLGHVFATPERGRSAEAPGERDVHD